MKALSIYQPWADYIKKNLKTLEVRTYPIKYRGEIIICSTKKPFYEDKKCGYALAICDLINCRKMQKKDSNKAMISYNPDFYVWELSNIKIIKPIKIKGQQGLYNITINLEYI